MMLEIERNMFWPIVHHVTGRIGGVDVAGVLTQMRLG